MALGDNTNQNKNELKERECLTRQRFYNAYSAVDPSTLQITYLFGMMQVKIAPLAKTATPEAPKYDYENQGKIFINHMDALKLSYEIGKFLADNTMYNNVGIVNNGGSLISISNGIEFGVTSPCLIIRKIGDDGEIVYTYVYEFNANSYAIRNFDEETKEYDKYFYGLVELEMFKITLDEYVKAMTAAMAYSINDTNRYDIARADARISAIHEKLGIEKPSNNRGGNGGGARTLFDSNPGRQSNTDVNQMSSVEDIKGLL